MPWEKFKVPGSKFKVIAAIEDRNKFPGKRTVNLRLLNFEPVGEV
jgi:hypothetical protein